MITRRKDKSGNNPEINLPMKQDPGKLERKKTPDLHQGSDDNASWASPFKICRAAIRDTSQMPISTRGKGNLVQRHKSGVQHRGPEQSDRGTKLPCQADQSFKAEDPG